MIFRGHLLTPTAAGGWMDLPDAAMEVRDGVIVSIARARKSDVDLRPNLILPGFVDAHAHTPQLAVCGVHSESLLDWLRRWVYPLEARFHGERAATLTRAFFREMVDNGTTTAAVYTSAWPDSVEAAFEAAGDLDLHAWIGPPLMDVGAYRSGRVLDEAEALAKRLSTPRRRFAVAPRFALSCSRELLEGAGDLARRLALPVMTHLNENPDEVREVRHRFHKPYVDVYEEAGLGGEGALFAHCVHMTRRDWAKVRRVAHCPGANLFLGSGTMDWAAASRSGATLAIGTDVGAGPDLSIHRSLRTAWGIHRQASGEGPSPEDLLRLATLGGAAALGFEDVGSLEIGKSADFQVLDHGRIVPPGSPPAESTRDLVSRVVHRADRAAILDVYVAGRRQGPARRRKRAT